MQITQQELATLSVYCATAQHTAWLLTSVARRDCDARLRLELARRANDALRHAKLWADTVRALGGTPVADAVALQSHYGHERGSVGCVLEVLALTQVAERRLGRQLLRHFHRSSTHPVVRATLRRMIEEEMNSGWCSPWLEQYALTEAERLREVQRHYADAERTMPDPFVEQQRWQDAA